MSTTQDGIHTTTNPAGTGWVNQADGVILTTHRLKTAAVARGQSIARRHGESLTIHRLDGSVISTRSYEVRPL